MLVEVQGRISPADVGLICGWRVVWFERVFAGGRLSILRNLSFGP